MIIQELEVQISVPRSPEVSVNERFRNPDFGPDDFQRGSRLQQTVNQLAGTPFANAAGLPWHASQRNRKKHRGRAWGEPSSARQSRGWRAAIGVTPPPLYRR
jgi:hypothetical protein